MQEKRITLTQFIAEEQRRDTAITDDLAGLLQQIAGACKTISDAVSRGALPEMPGSIINNRANQVERQDALPPNRLNVIANGIMLNSLAQTGHLAAMASGKMEGIHPLPPQSSRGRYLLVFSPLDGSTNIDVNVAVGTIFSILSAPEAAATVDGFKQAGARQVCAGFALYGPATMLILTTGHGVNAFTLERDSGEFVLTHPQMAISPATQEFAINTSNERFWEPPIRRYIGECLAGKTGARNKDFNMRWIASLVAETYRILTRGGIFMYPVDAKTKARGGRLQLLFEANPIAFIIEQAGGAATTGHGRIMDLLPENLHQHVPLIFGSKEEIDRIADYHQEYVSGKDAANMDSPLFSTRSLFRF